ncbi:MAG: aldehyde dehydrogenase family protein, partial [Desulfosalsimonadaceae bacterium]|nr:aldehyde dehydrogenase family protein [Desulfosalsimonadaceae bacterium]
MMKLSDPALFREQAYINGRWVDAGSGRCITVFNPSTNDAIGTVPLMGREETQQAIDAANAAWVGWRSKTARERAAILRRWHDLMLANREDLAILMTAEQGKPLAESRGEITYAASFIEWFAEEGKRVYGEVIPAPVAGQRLMTTRMPVGVCAAITP